jgi:hypothetical protein
VLSGGAGKRAGRRAEAWRRESGSEARARQRNSGFAEIGEAGFEEALEDGNDEGGGKAEQEQAVGSLDGAEEAPGRRHNDIAVTQRGVVDRGVVKGGTEVAKFAAEDEEESPEGDLDDVCEGREQDDPKKNGYIDPEAGADAAVSFFAAKELEGDADGEEVNQDREETNGYAN